MLHEDLWEETRMKMFMEGGDREEEECGMMDGAGKHVSTGGCSHDAASQVRRPSRLTLGCQPVNTNLSSFKRLQQQGWKRRDRWWKQSM